MDVIYYRNDGQLEYDLVVAPGASTEQIQLESENTGRARIAPTGDLELPGMAPADPVLRMSKPVAYQDIGGVRKLVEAHYTLFAQNRVGFEIGAYDHSQTLVIDPVVTYSTYLGGGLDETAYATANDSAGNTYVTGSSDSGDFPATSGSYKTTAPGGASDVFVAKYSPAGALVWSTYLGGSGGDVGYGIAVDSSNNVYVTGYTSSTDFPTTAGAYKSTYQGGVSDAFLVKLNAAGNSILYSTYIGGAGGDIAYAVALDAANEPTVTGSTQSTNFPVTAGAYAANYGGGLSDAFVARLSAAGTSLVYGTYLGGSGEDVGYGVAVDSKGNAYVTGYTQSANFPATAGVAQTANAGAYDGFVTALNTTGTALVYSTFLGGTGDDFGVGIAADASGNAWVTGYTSSTDYPHTAGVLQAASAGGYDAVVTKVSPAGKLVYSTFLGGSGDDYGMAIAVDGNGNAFVTGDTSSADFPLVGPVQAALAGEYNAFVAQVNAAGTAVSFSTYLGGGASDTGYGIALDGTGGIEVGGTTTSLDFPVSSGAAQGALAGASDAFVLRLGSQANQTISFSALGNQTFGTAVTLSATASSGLPVSFSSLSPSVCTVSGTTATLVALGTCVIGASQAGNASYAAAISVAQSFTVTQGSQTITFGALPNRPFGITPFALSATASSGLSVSFLSLSPAVCTVSGTTVTLVAVGTCIIGASQAGNASYAAAISLTQSFTVTPGGQTITFGALANQSLGAAAFAITASASSGLAVSFASTTTGVCTVSGSTVTLVAAGTCTIQATQAGSASYSAATAVNQSFTVSNPSPPAVVSVTPGSGSGISQTFGVTVSSAAGAANIGSVYLLVNSGLSAASGCYAVYNRVANAIQLANDGGTAWSNASPVGSGAAVSNSQCSVSATGSSASSAGNNLTVNFAVTFTGAFTGSKTVYVNTYDTGNQGSSWQTSGTWLVIGSGTPSVVSVTPASGSGASQSFAVAVSDTAGASALGNVYMVVSSTLTGASSCYMYYNPAARVFQLANDGGSAWLSGSSISNSQCTLNTASSSATASGNNLTVNFALSFASGYGGTKNVYVIAYDLASQNTGWQAKGTWATSGAGTPSVVSVTPGSGSGSSQTFAVTVSDTAGAASAGSFYVVVSGALTGTASCYLSYNPATQVFLLANDAGSAWLSGAATSNSQCTLNTASSSASASGNNLTVNFALSFASGYVGAKNVYAIAYDVGGQNSGWQTKGTWTVPGAAGTPSITSITPASGSGSSQTFALSIADTAGGASVSGVYLVVSGTLSGSGSCYLSYNPATQVFLLANDAGTAWQSGSSISNSQCTLNTAASLGSASGNNLTVNFALSFASGYAGTKNVYAIAYDLGGQNTGWKTKGTWTVPGASGTPSVTSVTPASGSGQSQTFAVNVADTAGAAAISSVYMVISGSLTGTSSCYLVYDRPSNSILLANDAGSAWSAPSSVGTGTTLSNSQCTVNPGAANVSPSGNNLTINVPVTFAAPYAGAKNVYVIAYDNSGLNSGWQATGTWTAQ